MLYTPEHNLPKILTAFKCFGLNVNNISRHVQGMQTGAVPKCLFSDITQSSAEIDCFDSGIIRKNATPNPKDRIIVNQRWNFYFRFCSQSSQNITPIKFSVVIQQKSVFLKCYAFEVRIINCIGCTKGPVDNRKEG